MPKIHIHPHIKAILSMHKIVLLERSSFPKVLDFLKAMAISLYEGYIKENEAACFEFSNYHPNYLGKTPEALFQADLVLQDAWICILHEYGFTENSIPNLLTEIDFQFEFAVDTLLAGDIIELIKCLDRDPRLINQASNFGHRATLLHYAASNAVEFWRQVVPTNICKIVSLLLSKGADKTAKIEAYGGQFTAFEMASTSIHPFDAGLQKELINLLR